MYLGTEYGKPGFSVPIYQPRMKSVSEFGFWGARVKYRSIQRNWSRSRMEY